MWWLQRPERGRSDLDNGDLIENAEREGYDVLRTTDQGMRYLQNLGGGSAATVVVLTFGHRSAGSGQSCS